MRARRLLLAVWSAVRLGAADTAGDAFDAAAALATLASPATWHDETTFLRALRERVDRRLAIIDTHGSAPQPAEPEAVPNDCRTLFDPETIAEARRASAGCSRLAYSSIDIVGEHPPLVGPRGDGGCVFVFVGAETLRQPAVDFVYLLHRRSVATQGFSRRLFSKLPKLLPHVLFPGKWTAFFDSKLHLYGTTLDELSKAYDTRVDDRALPFTAFPHALKVRKNVSSAFEWMRFEIEVILEEFSDRVASVDALRNQLARYVARTRDSVPPRAYTAFIDGALLLQRDAHQLFGPWCAETIREDSSDRDQLSFAFTVARLRLEPRLLDMCVTIAANRTLCHWFDDDSLGALHRISYEASRNIVDNGDFAAIDDVSAEYLDSSTWAYGVAESWSRSGASVVLIKRGDTDWLGTQPVRGNYLQGIQNRGSYIYQTVVFPADGFYRISFYACSRPGRFARTSLRATVTRAGHEEPAVVVEELLLGYSFTKYEATFYMDAGCATLVIMNDGPPGDRTLLVDAVRIERNVSCAVDSISEVPSVCQCRILLHLNGRELEMDVYGAVDVGLASRVLAPRVALTRPVHEFVAYARTVGCATVEVLDRSAAAEAAVALDAVRSLLRAPPSARLRDAAATEALVLACGVDDGTARAMPAEVLLHAAELRITQHPRNVAGEYAAYGLRISRYPRQFGAYVAFLAAGPLVTSYLEIGCRWGGAFVFTVEVLGRLGEASGGVGADDFRALAIDKWQEPLLLQEYAKGAAARFLKLDPAGAPFAELLAKTPMWDLVLIDGDHSYDGVRRDFDLVRNRTTRYIVLHDIASDEPSCVGVRRFWREVRDQFETHEFVEQYDDVDGSYFGIGVIVVPR